MQLTAKPQVSLIETDLPSVLLDKRKIRLAHVVKLECEKPLALVGRLRALNGILVANHAVLQLVVSAHRVLGLAVVVL